jgi:hypothetical protein
MITGNAMATYKVEYEGNERGYCFAAMNDAHALRRAKEAQAPLKRLLRIDEDGPVTIFPIPFPLQ